VDEEGGRPGPEVEDADVPAPGRQRVAVLLEVGEIHEVLLWGWWRDTMPIRPTVGLSTWVRVRTDSRYVKRRSGAHMAGER
jgi:hypothetical protein